MTEAFDGIYNSQHYNEAQTLPLHEYTKKYHSGRSDEVGEKQSTLGRFVKLFGRSSHAHMDFPQTPKYEGALESTIPQNELSSHPLESYVEKYNEGFYSKIEDKLEEPKKESGQIFSVFRRGNVDFPVSERYEGPIESTNLDNEMPENQLEGFVSPYHPGFSDLKPLKDVVNYPKTEEYLGPLSSTRHFEAGHLPLEHHVRKYNTEGRSDLPKQKPSVVEKLTGIFKKDEGYPRREIYEGELQSTNRRSDIDGHPLESHVSVYSSGIYEPKLIVSEQAVEPIIESKCKFLKKMVYKRFNKTKINCKNISI
jgi:hypothetical protein